MKAIVVLLTDAAACRDADPQLFDAMSGPKVFDALSYCDRCEVVRECETFVRPRKSFFDGVAAGRVWRAGRVVDPSLDESWGAVDLGDEPAHGVRGVAT